MIEYYLPFSVGEARVREDMDEERFTDATDNIDGYCASSISEVSSPSAGNAVSTIASKQFTNNSAFSAVQLL